MCCLFLGHRSWTFFSISVSLIFNCSATIYVFIRLLACLLTMADKSGTRANSLAINARNTWWSFISNDAGLLHATLATWALYGMLLRGMDQLRVDKLRHKNEAIKEINTKIAGPGGKFSDELVGTVATLASFEVSRKQTFDRTR